MTIFPKKKGGPQQLSKLEKRVASISTPELVTWVENSLFVIGKEVTGWMKTHEPVLLDEALVGAEAMYVIVKELKKRANEL